MNDKIVDKIMRDERKGSGLGTLRLALSIVVALCGVVSYLFIQSKADLKAEKKSCAAEKAVYQISLDAKDAAIAKLNEEKAIILQRITEDYKKRIDEQESFNREVIKTTKQNEKIINTLTK